jgi:hypothetical protein
MLLILYGYYFDCYWSLHVHRLFSYIKSKFNKSSLSTKDNSFESSLSTKDNSIESSDLSNEILNNFYNSSSKLDESSFLNKYFKWLIRPFNLFNTNTNKGKNSVILLEENFKNFSIGYNNNEWHYLLFGSYVTDDGKIIKDYDGIVLDSTKFIKVPPNGYTDFRLTICKELKHSSSELDLSNGKTEKNGYFVEFMCSHISSGTENLPNFLSNVSTIPDDDLRLAFSSLAIVNDDATVQIAFTNKTIYLLYGVYQSCINRDKFYCAIPLIKRDVKLDKLWDQMYAFAIDIKLNGNIKVLIKYSWNEHYKELIQVPNIGIPISKNIIFRNSQNGTTFKSSPIIFENPFICIGSYTLFTAINPFLNDNRVLYNDGINKHFNCTSDNDLTEAESVSLNNLYEPLNSSNSSNPCNKFDQLNPSILNYGQGTKIKFYYIKIRAYNFNSIHRY